VPRPAIASSSLRRWPTEASIEGPVGVSNARAGLLAARRSSKTSTLVAPPASALDEAEWTRRIVCEVGAGLLLDLHNLYANAVNFGDDPHTLLRRFPLKQVAAVHLGGGHWIDGPDGARRLLDDHLRDVPSAVFDLLRELGRVAPQPLTVILERDGRFPPIARLLD
jgi:uncharacterized protein (UPF0276 family)